MPRLSFLNDCLSSMINCFWTHTIRYSLNRFLCSFLIPWLQKNTNKLLQLASRHLSQQIFNFWNWKHVLVQCAHGILVIGKYFMHGNITSWKTMEDVICLHCLKDKYWVGKLMGIVLSFLRTNSAWNCWDTRLKDSTISCQLVPCLQISVTEPQSPVTLAIN